MDYDTINSSQKITDKKASLLQTSHLSVPPGTDSSSLGGTNCKNSHLIPVQIAERGKSAKTKGKKSSQEARTKAKKQETKGITTAGHSKAHRRPVKNNRRAVIYDRPAV